MTFKCTLIVQYTTGSEDIKRVNLFEPNVSTSANVNRLIGNQNLVSDWGFLYTGIRHGKNISLCFSLNTIMYKEWKKCIQFIRSFRYTFFLRLLEILHNYLIYILIKILRIHLCIHFQNVILRQYLTLKYHKIVAKIFITQYVKCEIRCVIWNIKLI